MRLDPRGDIFVTKGKFKKLTELIVSVRACCFIDTEEGFYCLSYVYFEIDVCLKGNENDYSKVYEKKRKRDSNVSEKAEGSKKEEVVKKAGKYNTKKKTQRLPKRRASSRLASVISSKKPEYTKKTVETLVDDYVIVVTVENSEDDDEDEAKVVERRSKKNDAQRIKNVNLQNSPVTRSKIQGVVIEEEEEEEVRERMSKTNMMEVCSKEIVKNTRSSTRKCKDKKVVEEGGKGKISVKGKKVVVEFEKPSRKKRQLYDEDDDDFVAEAGPSRKQKGKVQEVKNPKKEVVRKPKAAFDFPSMKNRCSPIALLSIIHGLSKAQKNCVREMGFGTLLQSKLMDVPMKMRYYVLERLDVEKMEVVVEKGVFNVNAKSVHMMLGLPIGGTLFKDMSVVDEDDEDSCMFEWRKQYENTKELRLKQLKIEILLTREGDLNFRINFLVMFINMFCESISMGKCNLNALQHIKKDTDISSINWCEYVVDCLIKTKKAYNPEKESSFFFGPAAYLALLYVDGLRFERMDVPRTRPDICFWSSEMIRVREDYEMNNGGFGLGEVNGEFVEDFVDISDDDEDDREYEEEVQEEDEEDSEVERCEEEIGTPKDELRVGTSDKLEHYALRCGIKTFW
ncbi:hypothetical protein LXL04_020664 [Taraxacum kok-saghyz]